VIAVSICCHLAKQVKSDLCECANAPWANNVDLLMVIDSVHSEASNALMHAGCHLSTVVLHCQARRHPFAN